MKSSKSDARWALAPSESRQGKAGGSPAILAEPPCRTEAPAQSTESWRAAWHLPTPLLYVFTVTFSLCVVYITLNCNSLNRRPNCFFICVRTNFLLMPCISFITWT